jgi:hypothetical protein
LLEAIARVVSIGSCRAAWPHAGPAFCLSSSPQPNQAFLASI